MKKILGIVLAVSVFATTAFAQATVSITSGHTLNIVEAMINGGENASDTATKFARQADGNGSNFKIAASTDNAGVEAEVDFSLDPEKTVKELGDIKAWFKIDWFKLSGGYFASRNSPKLKDGTVLNFSWLAPKNLGVSIDGATAADADNITNGKLATLFDFNIDMDAFKILLQLSVFSSTKPDGTGKIIGGFDKDGKVYSGFGVGFAFSMENMKIDLAFKMPTYQTGSVGLWFSMTPVDFLQFLVGGAVGWNNAGRKAVPLKPEIVPYASDINFGVDARLRVTPLDALAITLHFNYSGMVAKNKNGDQVDINGPYDGKNGTGIYCVLNTTYNINDMLAVFGELGFWTAGVKKLNKEDARKNYHSMGGQVGLKVKPVENATLGVGINVVGNVDKVNKEKINHKANYENVEIAIPFTFEVAF